MTPPKPTPKIIQGLITFALSAYIIDQLAQYLIPQTPILP